MSIMYIMNKQSKGLGRKSLTFDEVQECIHMYLNGSSQQKIADHFGVSRGNVRNKLIENGVSQRCPGEYRQKCVNHDFFKVLNNDNAYWLGLLAADGSVNEKGVIRLKLTAEDKKVIEEWKSALDSEHTIEKITPKGYVDKYNGKYYTPKEQYELRFTSHQMINDLEKYGIVPSKSLIITYPKIPAQLNAAFIRGFFDGDGCITTSHGRPRVKFTSGSKKFLEQLQKILNKHCNVKPTTINHSSRVYYFVIDRKDNIQSLYDFMYKNANSYMERKHTKFQQLLGEKCE